MSDNSNKKKTLHQRLGELSPSPSQDAVITEDGPTMRSVAIMSSPPAMSFQRLSIGDNIKTPSKSFTYQNSAYDTKPKIVLSDTKVTPIEANPWKVAKAPTLPANYHLDRSNVRIPSDTTPTIISKRITDLFYEHSIAATYDHEQALAIASTSTCLKFHVRLWNDSKDDATIVEIQRYAGCSIDFQVNAREILLAAKFGKEGNKTNATRPSMRSFSMPIPRFLPKIPDSVWESNTKEAVDIARSNLKDTDRVDSHAIAITSLEQLSRCNHCRVYFAREILARDSDILPILVSILHRSDLSARNPTNESVCGVDECYQLMRRETISTIANCMETAQDKTELHSGAAYCISLLTAAEKASSPPLSALVHDIANAEANPHDAAVSCRCVQLICQFPQQHSSDIKQLLLDLDTTSYISKAVSSAKCRHSLLQEELVRLMQIL